VDVVLSYETVVTEEHVQSYVYDFNSFISSAGGNLGLFVGFSCLSTMLGIISFVMDFQRKRAIRKDVTCA